VKPLMKHTDATAVRVTNAAILRSGEGRATAPNGEPYDHRFIASTERLATDGGIILVDAWRVDAYMKRPRWIAMHDLMGYSGPLTQVSLGRSVYVAVEGGLPTDLVGPTGRALVAYVRYASTPFAQEVKTLYDEGGLDDVSVRWDWQTEIVRAPYEDEVQKYGENLYWICERADLMELSSVLMGADYGAQQLRSNVVEAFERVRAKHPLPELEKFVRASQRQRGSRPARAAVPDLVSTAECVEQMTQGVASLSQSNNDRDTIAHQMIVESLTGLENLVQASEPSADVTDAVAAFHAALAVFAVAQKHGRQAINEMTGALSKMKTALGLGEILVELSDDRTVALDLGAIAADTDDAVDKLFALYTKTVA
jgi:hypothetical protein